LDKASLTAKADPHRSFLAFDLEVAGKKVSRNLIFFDVAHNLELPVAPAIETALTKTGEGYDITLQSAKLARGVYVSFGDLDVQSSDNYFDLLPAEPLTIHLKSSATADELKAVLKTMSLTEAFNPN
jgi:beta-mannosidase